MAVAMFLWSISTKVVWPSWISNFRLPHAPTSIAIELPASVAHLDARPTGDQEVAGLTPAEVGNILSWRLIMKYFLRSFSPFR